MLLNQGGKTKISTAPSAHRKTKHISRTGSKAGVHFNVSIYLRLQQPFVMPIASFSSCCLFISEGAVLCHANGFGQREPESSVC